MILVTLGTQKESFKRLLDYVNSIETNEEIIVQAGYTKYESDKMKIFPFINYDEMNELINKADLIITHGGTGSIISPLEIGKKVIACARLKKYDEHVDNHQEEIVDMFADEKYILKITENDDINKILKEAKKFKPKKYQSNTKKFIEKLKQEIEDCDL